MRKKISNILFNINYWLDANPSYILIILLISVSIFTLSFTSNNLYFMMISFIYILLVSIIRWAYIEGVLKFSHDVYKIPNVGEIAFPKKNFTYYGLDINKDCVCNIIEISKNITGYTVSIGVEQKWCINIDLKIYNKHFITKSDIRNSKLSKLGV